MCGLNLSNAFRTHSSQHLSTDEKRFSMNQTASTNLTYSTTRTIDTDDFSLPPARPHQFETTPSQKLLPRQEIKRAASTASKQRSGSSSKKKNLAPSISSITPDPSKQRPQAVPSPAPIHSYAFTSTLYSVLSERESQWIHGATNYVREYMQGFDSSHDFAHVQRVLKHALHILHVESATNPSTHYDPTIVTLAALFHDVGDKKYRDRQTLQRPKRLAFADEELPSSSSDDVSSRFHHGGHPSQHRHPKAHSRPALHDPQLAALLAIPHDDPETLVKRVLLRLGAPQELARTVQRVVKNISYSHEILDPSHVRGVMLRHPELAIVQDADRLDAIGAIGIGRCFTYGGACSSTRKPSLLGQGGNIAGSRTSASTVGGGAMTSSPGRSLQESADHVEEKLVRLESLMKTREGKRLARVRTERLRVFQGWWEEEMGPDQFVL